ncbi:MAG: hypothetical protein QOH56_4062 [Pseudonocardiales bacterium]|nr:hypothetical protein [Pseudonocardiales bacterium]
MAALTTPDGWQVDVVVRDGRQWFRVKRHGYLTGGGKGKMHGLVATIEEVEKLLGESFKLLA